jgi:SIR2-like domain
VEIEQHRIVVFAGAGASYAVDKENYPTTAGFVSRLPEAIAGNPFLANMSQNFEAKFGDGTPDIEKVLWCLDELIEHLEHVNNAKSPINWFLPNNLLPKLLGIGIETGPYAHVARTAVPVLQDLKNKINAHLYDVYGEIPSKQSLEDNWTLLLESLNKEGYWIDLVTTNYDLVLESAVDNVQLDIGYGQLKGAIPRLDTSKWDRSIRPGIPPYKDGIVTKLHGSLNWERDKKGIVFSGTNFKTDHKHHAAIYPGFKGLAEEEPFSIFHDYFRESIRKASHVIFIGFAFRDEHINAILEETYRSDQYVAIDPSSLAEMPSGLKKRVHHIKEGFGKKSVGHVMRQVVGALTERNNP